MSSKVVSPLGWLIILLVCASILFVAIWIFFFDVQVGRGAGKVLASLLGEHVSGMVGAFFDKLVDMVAFF